jgi:SAM-dependent methyltransferase
MALLDGGRARKRLRGAVGRASDTLFPARSILANRFVSAKLLPLSAGAKYPVQMRTVAPRTYDDFPSPPPELWDRWGDSLEWYLAAGQADVDTMVRILVSARADEELRRVLDFGCAEGRMLRFFPRTDDSELWGVDINADRIAWAQQHLSPPFRFATTTTAPHLPFEDNYFDLVYSLSVFTHISDLADAWFLELLRVVRPGGYVYATVHDEHTLELLLGRHRDTHSDFAELVLEFDKETATLSGDWTYFAILADPAAQVFYNSSYLVSKWSQFAECLAVEREVAVYQTALVFRKANR